jgi:replicative DNA helicase
MKGECVGRVIDRPLEIDDPMLRIPPHSVQAEYSVLGGLLLDNSAWDHAGDLLVAGDFYQYEHRLIFTAIAELVSVSRPADVVTVFEALQSHGRAGDVGGLTYLNSLAQFVHSAANVRRYAEIVREKSILRRLVSAGDEIASAAFNLQKGKGVATLLEESVQRVLAIDVAGADADWESVDTGLVRVLDRIQAEANGESKADIISTGLRALDERLDGGGRPGELIVIGARPGMGKSALGLTIGVHAAANGEPTGYWSGEMAKAQLWNRALALASAVHLSRLKRTELLQQPDWTSITHGVEKLRSLPFHVNDRPSMTIANLRAAARALKRKHGLRVLVVDYLGLMDGTDPRQLRTYQLEEITKGLKQLAKEQGIVVYLLVQVSRKVEERPDQMPILSDLRDSGAIEQDADVVIFVHRPIKVDPDLAAEWKPYALCSLAKVRDGEPGKFDLMYVGENTRFMDWPQNVRVPTSKVRFSRPGRVMSEL